MAVQLNHSSNNGELSLSAWKELDMKFLSNDTATSAQKMLQSVTPIDRLDHILNHSSLYIRASDLTIYLENVGSIHLKQHYQLIVEAIFGQNSKYPSWALRSITKSSNPREAAVILRLLGATGSLLSLATSLLEDPGFMVEVGLDRLPFALSQRILQGDVPPYFSTRLCVTDPFQQASPMIKCLRVNSFEYFFLSYASHICALKGLGFTSDYLVGWGTMTDNLYNNLLDDYLVYFFPCTGAGVPCDNFRLSYQQANDSLYLGQTLSSRLLNSPASGNSCTSMSPRLLKASVLMEQPHLSGGGGDSFFRKGRSHKEVWRTETIWLICTEIWMAHAPGVTPYQNCSPTSTDQFGKVVLPTVDVVKSVRMLVRHSHFFLNCITSHMMHPMEELRRDVYPTYQKRLYKFLRHLFYNWPLDTSFRIVYETWLSYIQPWRYLHFEKVRSSPGKEVGEDVVDARWHSFISENIMFFSKLFNIMLSRMNRVDFATAKNAMMFYRVAKVFTGPEYLRLMLLDIEHAILSYDLPYSSHNGIPMRSPSSPTSSSTYLRMSSSSSSFGEGPPLRSSSSTLFRVIEQLMKDWEHPEFTYEPLFSENNKKLMFGLMEAAKGAKSQLQEVIDATLEQQKRNQTWWDKLLGTNKEYNLVVGQSVNELVKAITQLDIAMNQFAVFFDLPIIEQPESTRAPVFTPTRLPRTTFIGNSLDGTALDGTENRITVLPSGTFTCDMLVPIGNPDYCLPRSDECNRVVYFLRNVSGFLNDKFAGDIMRLYFQKSWKGRVARAAFAEPIEYFDVERRGRVREKTRKVLPPRINLRLLSSINFLFIMAALILALMICGFTKFGIFLMMLFFWVIYIAVKAVSESESKLDDLIYLFGDRNYNVDFRGRRERMTLEQG